MIARIIGSLGFAAMLVSSGVVLAQVQPAPTQKPAAPPLAATPAVSAVRHTALSLIETPRFAKGFAHFDWVNPDAPKGGVLRMSSIGGFDTLNAYSIKGSRAPGLGLLHDSLFESSPDEATTGYGLIAAWVSFPPDFSSATFGLRPEAKFHDGKPIRPEDVIFSLQALKKVNPFFSLYYKNVIKAEKTAPGQVTFHFNAKGNRELPQIVSELPILAEHYWISAGPNGKPRDLAKSTLEPPVGSGPYRIKIVKPGRFIVYERFKGHWAKDLAVRRGQYNFDELRFTNFRDATPAFESFKAGQLDLWTETSSKRWATGYDFAAVKDGRVNKSKIPRKSVAAMQAFIFNLRRKKFSDPRLRRAFNFAFDFEWANKNLFYGQYTRIGSYFDNSELASRGLPEGRELAFLEEVRAEVPPEVFTTPFVNPINDKPQDLRKNLKVALKLLAEAGWTLKAVEIDDPDCGIFCKLMKTVGLKSARTRQVLRNAKGETLSLEILLVSPSFERVVLPLKANLEKLGVKASVRIVDAAQFEQRVQTFDYDMIVATFPQSLSPGNEQREFWGSAAADRDGSRNRIGIKNPAVDKLIKKLIFAKSRAELVAATRALDRVLLWNHYVVPQWHLPATRLAHWAMMGRPAKLPSLQPGVVRAWWYDEAKAKILKQGRSK